MARCAKVQALAGALILALFGSASTLVGQSIRGTVRAGDSGDAQRDILVSLLDTSASVIAAVRTDAAGRFRLPVAEPGTYAVTAVAIGYQRVTSGWLQLKTEDTLDVTLRLPRLANILTPVTITAQRDSLMALDVMGVSLRTLAGTFVTQGEIERASTATSNITEVVQNLRIPAIALRHFKVNTGDPRLDGERSCLVYSRAVRNACVTVVIDGIKYTSDENLLQLDSFLKPEQIRGMVFIRPAEAGVLFGADTCNGVLLVITKTGRQ